MRAATSIPREHGSRPTEMNSVGPTTEACVPRLVLGPRPKKLMS